MQERTFIGLDVHARSIQAGVLDGLTGEVKSLAVPVATKALVAWVCAQPGPAVTYEAGPTGYELARALAAAGVPCLVAAPSRIPRAPGDRVKTDRRDAVRLATLLRLGELTAVRVPGLAEEAARDLVRAREDARGDLMRARHRLSKLLLRRGIVWEARAWTQAHELWLSRQRFSERPRQIAYEEALAAMFSVRDRRDAHRFRPCRRDRRLAALFRAQPPRLPRPDPLRELLWRLAASGRDHAGRQRACAPPAGRGRLAAAPEAGQEPAHSSGAERPAGRGARARRGRRKASAPSLGALR